MDKYIDFLDYLKRETRDDFYIDLSEIERIAGVELPNSAYGYTAYWNPSETHTFAVAINKCGFKIIPDLTNKRIRLVRVGSVVPSQERNSKRINPHMTQMQEIMMLLRNNEMMTLKDFSIAMYGDDKHVAYLNETVMLLVRRRQIFKLGDRPAYYSLNENARIPQSEVTIKTRVQTDRLNLPKPSVQIVEEYLTRWDSLEDYVAQENAIDRLFLGEFNSNDNLEHILIKCSVLNDFYSTNIFKIYPVAKHILSLNIDERLKTGDPTLVDEIARVEFFGGEKNFYSFASKYCSHHNPLEYPIYDSYVRKVLNYYRKVDRFFSFGDNDLKNYPKFKEILVRFREFYKLDKYNLKELDKYLWQFGKEHFPNNY